MSNRRLIEDSLPLAEISEQSAREKYIRKGHISTLHLWWARRPLAACRAAVYAALVDAPKTPAERKRHHELIKKIVDWDVLDPSHPDHGLLKVAAENIGKAHAARVARRKGKGASDASTHPRVLDPFTGGGAIPLEAQRLGCETYANDLNPVAHVIELGSIFYPQRFAKDVVQPKKVGDLLDVDTRPEPRLAVEVERWANWVQQRVAEEVGSLYPSSAPDREVLGYFWVRQVHCSNPACRVLIPVVNQTWLANKANRKIAYRIKSNAKRTGVEYSLHYDDIDFDPKAGTYGENKLLCPCCGEVTDGKYMRAEGMAGRLEQDLVLVCEVSTKEQGRFYRLANATDRAAWKKAVDLAAKVKPIEGDVSPDRPSGNARGLSAVTRYGMSKFADFFNARQTVTLDAYARAIRATRDEIAKTGEELLFADAVACYLPQ
jgi:putative DNA methylase